MKEFFLHILHQLDLSKGPHRHEFVKNKPTKNDPCFFILVFLFCYVADESGSNDVDPIVRTSQVN